MRTINEESAYRTTVYFETDDVPVIPSTVHYSLRCETTNTTLIDRTAATADYSVVIDIPASYNDIIRSSNEYETKVLTIWTDYGTDAQQTDEERYRVKNMSGVGDPVGETSDY